MRRHQNTFRWQPDEISIEPPRRDENKFLDRGRSPRNDAISAALLAALTFCRCRPLARNGFRVGFAIFLIARNSTSRVAET